MGNGLINDKVCLDFIASHFQMSEKHCAEHNLDPDSTEFSMMLAHQYAGVASFVNYLGLDDAYELFLNASCSCAPDGAVTKISISGG